MIPNPYIKAVSYAIKGADKAVDEWHSQSAKNDYYRNIEGGTVGNAVGERLREEAYRWQTMGVFSEEEASKAQKGVTRIGYNNRTDQRSGMKRQEALDYIYDAKKSRGQSVEMGLEQVSVASKSLNVDLGSLQKAMEAVANTAGKAGVNSEMAVRQYTQMVRLGIARGQGAGSVGFAQAIQETNVSMGRDYASNVDSSQAFSKDRQYRAAAMSGMTAGKLLNMERNDPAGAAKAYDKLNKGDLASAGITKAMQDKIKAAIDLIGGPEGLRDDPNQANRIANDFLADYLASGRDPNALPEVLSSLTDTDFGGNPEMAARWVVAQVGGNSSAAQAARNQQQAGKTDLNGKTLKDGTQNTTIGTMEDFTKSAGNSTAVAQYKNTAAATGQRDQVSESLLKSESLLGDKGNKTHVLVSTKDGRRVLTLDEAMKEFPYEVATGQVEFIDGDAKGKSVQQLAGITDTSTEARAGATTEMTRSSGVGQSEADYEAKNGQIDLGADGKDGARTTVVIELSDEAKRYFKQPAPSSNPLADAAAAGQPPDPSTGVKQRYGPAVNR